MLYWRVADKRFTSYSFITIVGEWTVSIKLPDRQRRSKTGSYTSKLNLSILNDVRGLGHHSSVLGLNHFDNHTLLWLSGAVAPSTAGAAAAAAAVSADATAISRAISRAITRAISSAISTAGVATWVVAWVAALQTIPSHTAIACCWKISGEEVKIIEKWMNFL